MEIRERLIKIISSEGLNAAAFADSIGVQRSSISHIISGRNKPSLDFLQKIISSYPKYNAEWLLVGLGEIYKQPKQSNFFTKTEVSGAFSPLETKKPPVKDEIKKEQLSLPLDALNLSKTALKEEDTPLYEAVNPSKPPLKKETAKKIHKIVIFYEDKTFMEYGPSSD
jgi:transcriptional regulator with XRE-family HTH domain